MKQTVRKWIDSSVKTLVLVVGLTFFASSCADDSSLDETSQSTQVRDVTTLEELPPQDAFGSALVACADNLTNDGCNFTAGYGRDYPNQFLMVAMMNNCRTESLPANCSWAGYTTQTRDIEVDLNNCCYPYSSFNFVLNNWKTLAASNRPAANYLIINYQRITGYMVTTYGPYRMVIRVTYRKKGLCSITGEKDVIALPQ